MNNVRTWLTKVQRVRNVIPTQEVDKKYFRVHKYLETYK